MFVCEGKSTAVYCTIHACHNVHYLPRHVKTVPRFCQFQSGYMCLLPKLRHSQNNHMLNFNRFSKVLIFQAPGHPPVLIQQIHVTPFFTRNVPHPCHCPDHAALRFFFPRPTRWRKASANSNTWTSHRSGLSRRRRGASRQIERLWCDCFPPIWLKQST